jgi:hypothetical protein
MRSSSQSLVPKNIKHIEGFKSGDVFGGTGYDAIFFRRHKEPESSLVDFDFCLLAQKEQMEFSEELGSHKWLILLFEHDKDSLEPVPNRIRYFQAYLGDALIFAKNQTKARSEGLMVKCCMSGFNLLAKVIQPANIPELKHDILVDAKKFCKKYDLVKR